MGIIIREADLDRELEVMWATLNANRVRTTPLARFRWMYLDNPDGRATAWLAVDDSRGQIAGFTAAFPRRIRLGSNEREVIAWNCGDFSINQQYRTLGAALKLRRAARDAVDRGAASFLYAHPNDRMLAVHLRVGHARLGRMVRYAKPLRTRRGQPLDRLSGALLRLAGADLVIRQRHEPELITTGALPQDIDSLYDDVAGALGTSVVRDRLYLDWRFRANPIERAEVLTTRHAGRLVGVAAVVITRDVAYIKDWMTRGPDATDQLFLALISHARARGLASLSATALETHPDIPRLRRLGFFRRPEVSTAVVYASGKDAVSQRVTDPAAWYMTQGDRDV